MHLSDYCSDLVWLRTGLRQSRLLLVLHIFCMILHIFFYDPSHIFVHCFCKKKRLFFILHICNNLILIINIFQILLQTYFSSMINSILINVFLQTKSASMEIFFAKRWVFTFNPSCFSIQSNIKKGNFQEKQKSCNFKLYFQEEQTIRIEMSHQPFCPLPLFPVTAIRIQNSENQNLLNLRSTQHYIAGTCYIHVVQLLFQRAGLVCGPQLTAPTTRADQEGYLLHDSTSLATVNCFHI